MVPCVENEASPSTNSALRTPPARARADIAYSLSPKTAVAVISPTGMRANENCIACVEVSFTVCTVAGCRRYQRECGARGENCYLDGARTKHHLGSVPWCCSRLCLTWDQCGPASGHYWRPLLPRIGAS